MISPAEYEAIVAWLSVLSCVFRVLSGVNGQPHDMALSEYEEFVMAELEAQFEADAPPPPRRDRGRLALSAVCFLGGVALLAAARDAGLVIRISDLWGFTTATVASGLSLAGHVVLLGSAFLLGRALYDAPVRGEGKAGTQTAEVSRERV